jgi:uncharacterized DUF497 family protein
VFIGLRSALRATARGYEWDDTKNASNVVKHGVGFDVIETADWGAALVARDTRIDYGEARFQAYLPIDGRLYVAVYVNRTGVRRIISLRKANVKERKQYGQAQKNLNL